MTSEAIQSPRLAQRAGNLVAAIENADPARPVCIDTPGADNTCVTELLYKDLTDADAVYEQHENLFYPDDEPISYRDLDLEAIMANTRSALALTQKAESARRSVLLGICVAQLGEMACGIADQPDSILAPAEMDQERFQQSLADTEISQTYLSPKRQETAVILSEHYLSLGKEAFHATLAARLLGEYHKIPFGNATYPGLAKHLYYSFWNNITEVRKIPPILQEKVNGLMHQFPAKVMRYDFHTGIGRMPFDRARPRHLRTLEAYQSTLQSPAPNAIDISSNCRDALQAVFLTLDGAARNGHTTENSFRIAVQNSGVIGQLTKRTNIDLPTPELFHLEESREVPELIIGHPTDKMHMSDALRRKIQQAGICPIRHKVEIPVGGRTHQGVEALAGVIDEQIGAKPPLLRQMEDRIYVDPAALVVNTSLFGLFKNYQANPAAF